jgi:hypothetical protein
VAHKDETNPCSGDPLLAKLWISRIRKCVDEVFPLSVHDLLRLSPAEVVVV